MSRCPRPILGYSVCPTRACRANPKKILRRASSWSALSPIAALTRQASGAPARSKRTSRSASSASENRRRPRPRVRRRRLRQGLLRCEELAPLAARQGQQGPVVLLPVLRQRGGHSPISPTEPRCSIQNRFAKRLDVPLFIFSQSVQLALEAGRTCGSCQATEVSGWSTCDDDGRWTCNTCYLKEFRASKKEKKD